MTQVQAEKQRPSPNHGYGLRNVPDGVMDMKEEVSPAASRNPLMKPDMKKAEARWEADIL